MAKKRMPQRDIRRPTAGSKWMPKDSVSLGKQAYAFVNRNRKRAPEGRLAGRRDAARARRRWNVRPPPPNRPAPVRGRRASPKFALTPPPRI